MVFLITALHHVMNPEETMKVIKSRLRPGGLIVVREHRPVTMFDKMYLDTCDLLFGFGITNEY